MDENKSVNHGKTSYHRKLSFSREKIQKCNLQNDLLIRSYEHFDFYARPCVCFNTCTNGLLSYYNTTHHPRSCEPTGLGILTVAVRPLYLCTGGYGYPPLYNNTDNTLLYHSHPLLILGLLKLCQNPWNRLVWL